MPMSHAFTSTANLGVKLSPEAAAPSVHLGGEMNAYSMSAATGIVCFLLGA